MLSKVGGLPCGSWWMPPDVSLAITVPLTIRVMGTAMRKTACTSGCIL